ncbi:cellulose binding domain-containing protein [Sorangium sp. So ce542]|uniref:cellulose binding domain-containing protein n=1 Tax=Sorangium sp. So ce542 TaxID=3133316 RepID=UPI003F634892
MSSSAGGDGGAGGIGGAGGAGGEGGADVTSTTASSSVSTTASSTTSATTSSSVSTTASSTTSATTGVGGGSATSSTTASSTTGGATTPALELQYAARETGAEAQQLSFKVRIRNTGDERIALSDLTIRYWFTADVEMVDLRSDCDFSGVTGGCANVTRAFHAASGTDADHYLELGFSAAAGSIDAGATSGESQIRIYNREVYDRMTQTDDYSFEATTAWTPSMQITVYHDGELAWGVEP